MGTWNLDMSGFRIVGWLLYGLDSEWDLNTKQFVQFLNGKKIESNNELA